MKVALIFLLGLVGCTSAFEEKADQNFAIIQQVLNSFNQRLAKVENSSGKEKVVSKKEGVKNEKAN